MSAPSAPDLSGKVVVVTGAAGAAGPPLVVALARAGAQVVVAGRSAQRLAEVARFGEEAAADSGRGGRVTARPVDLLDAAATQDWARQLLADFGHVEGLLHLVGGWRGGQGIAQADPQDWEWLQRNLVLTLIHAGSALHDTLRDAGGRLAIVSSPQAQTPNAKNAAYAAAKAAAEAWTLAVADSWRDTAAAAVIVPVKALLTEQMRHERPDRKFPGYTHVDALAAELAGLWERGADELNGSRL